ncbi:MAG TPA: tRNA pseudouridine(55) synthase TruB [Mycobacteriales bacterium]|nr:tRNA pseudouridine(55) synthase TruB [Mycobacteriales bacterium]
MSAADGLVVVDKPAGWTSHDVVAKVRRFAGTRKVGHAGTLDPMATGVLVLGVERATRLLGHLALHDKEYDATIRLGRGTTTDDADGEYLGADAEGVAADIEDARIAQAMSALIGDIDQVPSSVSAIKVDGVRAYKRARDGEVVELKARRVTVEAFDLVERRGNELDVRVTCSTGTYVRALARDLGTMLGVGGHLTALRRTRSGPYTVDEARSLEELERSFTTTSLAEAVGKTFPVITVTDEDALRISHGQRLALPLAASTTGVFTEDGRVIALVEDRGGVAQPVCVFV